MQTLVLSGLARILHQSTLARSASEGNPFQIPRLRFGLVYRTPRATHQGGE